MFYKIKHYNHINITINTKHKTEYEVVLNTSHFDASGVIARFLIPAETFKDHFGMDFIRAKAKDAYSFTFDKPSLKLI